MLATPTFVNTTGGDYNIDNFVVLGAAKDKAVDIQVMSDTGAWIGHYYWFREYYNKKTGVTTPAGWFDLKGTTSAGVMLKPGYGIFVNVTADGLKLQSAGQVPGSITNEVTIGKYLLGNSSPVEIAIDKFEVVGATKDKAVDIQVMSSTGAWVGHYYWFREYYNKKTGVTTPAGWFDLKGTTPAGYSLKSGESVFVNVTAAGMKIVVPSAL